MSKVKAKTKSDYAKKVAKRFNAARSIGSSAFIKSQEGKLRPFPSPLMCEV